MVEELIKLIRNNKTVAFTGAGVSEESGIPTFRGKQGLWEKYDPQIYATLPPAFYSFLRSPEKIAKFIIDFYATLLKAKPNSAHYALAKFEKEGYLLGVITQNIDNLHQFAGTKNISELHGNAYRFFCRRCGNSYMKSKEEVEKFIESLTKLELFRKKIIKQVLSFLGRCRCRRTLVPSVVFFGQKLPEEELNKTYNLLEDAEVLLSIGTSGVVFPAANIPFYAKERGCKIVEINPQQTEISSLADIKISKPASSFFSKVLEYLK